MQGPELGAKMHSVHGSCPPGTGILQTATGEHSIVLLEGCEDVPEA